MTPLEFFLSAGAIKYIVIGGYVCHKVWWNRQNRTKHMTWEQFFKKYKDHELAQ
ncbi:hypothetical protein JOD01_003889 [Brevibacillus fulvus]|uniref:Uncharacterized protein n=1 Tax=Brevibacillus fulvus TaxID=1125967 RepID=A0A938Y632_9BACL|nr:hypothetical protein [Brevibacillus fulvus]